VDSGKVKVSTAWILFKIIDEVDTSTVNCQLSTVHCESFKFQFMGLLRTGEGGSAGDGLFYENREKFSSLISLFLAFIFEMVYNKVVQLSATFKG
jgi:hypothetical protein